MKCKTANSLFPSPDTEAERVAERVYYAEPHPQDALTTIPKTAPIIEEALNSAIAVAKRDIVGKVHGILDDWTTREGEFETVAESANHILCELEKELT